METHMKGAERMPCSSLFCHRKEVILSTQLCLFDRFSSCRLSRYFSILCQGLIIKMTIRQTDFTYRVKFDLRHKQGEQETDKEGTSWEGNWVPHFVLASPTAGQSKSSSSC